MHYSAITTFILLIAAPVAMAGVAANPADGMNLFDTRATCLKNDCGGAGGCAGAWCCVRYKDGCKCIAPGDLSENGELCPSA